MRKVFVLSLIVGLSIGLIVGASLSAAAQEAKKEMTVGYILKNLTNPYFVDTLKGAEQEAEKRGWKVISVVCMDDPNTMLSQVEDFVQQDVDLIVSFIPSLEAGGVAADKAYEAGIPFVAIDNHVKSTHALTILACDDIPSGEMQAQYVIDRIGTKGTVVILEGIAGELTAYQRSLGNQNVFKKYPDIKLIIHPADWNAEKAMRVMENVLVAEPRIDAVVTNNDTMVLGALSALEAAGKAEGVTTVGWDAIPPAIEAIKEGQLDATVQADAVGLGRNSIIYGEKMIKGEPFDATIRNMSWGVASTFIMSTKMVDKENVEELYPGE